MGAPKGTRPPGGSRKGIPNKAKAAREAELKASGLLPLDYMLQVLRNPETEPARRDWAAKSAAPYVHPTMASVTIGNKPGERFAVSLLPSDDD